MEDLQREAMHTLIQIQKLAPELFDSYMGEPMNENTLTKMKWELSQLNSTVEYPDTQSGMSTLQIFYDEFINTGICDISCLLTTDNVVDKVLDSIEDEIEDFIYNNFDRYYIQEAGECIYSVLTEKAYEITEKVITEQENYDLPSEQKMVEKIIEVAYNAINFTNMYEIIDDILNQPITMEEKLAEVGMSYKDFFIERKLLWIKINLKDWTH